MQSPPHPSPLPYHLHRSVFIRLPAPQAILYARQHLLAYIPTQEVLKLLTSTLYTDSSPYTIPNGASLAELFREEFCRRHSWAKEDPLEVVVDLGSRGGALNAVEKARRVMGAHLGDVRKWDELPVSSRHTDIVYVTLTGTCRWRSRSRRLDVITRFSYVRSRKNNRRNRIHPRCSHAVTSWPQTVSPRCSRLGECCECVVLSRTDQAGGNQPSAHTVRPRRANSQRNGLPSNAVSRLLLYTIFDAVVSKRRRRLTDSMHYATKCIEGIYKHSLYRKSVSRQFESKMLEPIRLLRHRAL